MVGVFTMGTLLRRFPRDLRNNLGKYLGIFLLLVVSIALVSGFLSAASSISKIIEDMPENTLSKMDNLALRSRRMIKP